MRRCEPTFTHRDARAQYYSVAITDNGTLALGRSDGSVRWIDTLSTARGAAPVKLPLARTFWIESLAMGDGVIVASSSIANEAYRLALATKAVRALPVHGRVKAVAMRGRTLAIAAGNCVTGVLGERDIETPSYCGMPWTEWSYDAVALSPDGARVAALACPPDWRSRTDEQRVARFDVEVLANEAAADPAWKPATRANVALAVRAGQRLPSLGWLGTTPALLDEEGVVRIEGERAVRVAWSSGFRAHAFAWAADHGVAIDAKGRLAFARESGLEVSEVRVEVPWANVALSPSGRWLAYAAGFAHSCVFDIGGGAAMAAAKSPQTPKVTSSSKGTSKTKVTTKSKVTAKSKRTPKASRGSKRR